MIGKYLEKLGFFIWFKNWLIYWKNECLKLKLMFFVLKVRIKFKGKVS